MNLDVQVPRINAMTPERDPIREAHAQWRAHGWDEAADGMAMVTSLARAHQLQMERIESVLRPYGLTFTPYVWSPRRACSTAMTPRSTSCGGSCRARVRGHPPGSQPQSSRRSSTRRSRRTSKGSPSPPTRAGTSNTSSTSSSSCARPGPITSRSSAVAAASSSPTRSQRLRDVGRHDLQSPEDGQRLGLVGMINQVVSACDFDVYAIGRRPPRRRPRRRPPAIARAITGAEQGRLDDRCWPSSDPAAGIVVRSRARHHRHRRLGQVVAHRRTRTAPARGPAGQAADRRVAVDPTRRKGGGALLGDRIRA
jgi:hypothetical protein